MFKTTLFPAVLALVLVTLFAFAAACGGDDDDDTDPLNGAIGDDDDDDEPEPGYPTTAGYEFVPAGTFLMGSPADERGRRPNEAQHEVVLTRDIEVKATEVTQGEYALALGYNPSRFPLVGADENLPVETVSWYDALAYANRLSALNDYDPCYVLTDVNCVDGATDTSNRYCADHGGIAEAAVALGGVDSVYDCEGFRLPTEAEWEYAARAGTATPYYTGPMTSVSCKPLDPAMDAAGWYCGNSGYNTQVVGGKEPNAFGLFDTLGNVKEWCWDAYREDLSADATDPEGPAEGHFRVVRGGAYRFAGAAASRVAYRSGLTPGYREYIVGLRPVRTLPTVAENRLPAQPAVKPEAAETAVDEDKQLPDSFPITFTRPQAGEPMSPAEIADFTRAITGFWKETGYFDFYRWTTHGMAADNEGGWDDFKLYFQVSNFVKDGDVVTFPHTGNSDNLMLRTGKLMNNAIALYLATGDADTGYLVSQFCKGVVALIRGFEWTGEDPEPELMPRAIFVTNNAYEEDGRRAFVDYDRSKKYDYDWNGWTYPNPVNPHYGSIWIRNMRSKDDVPHIFRIVPMLLLLVRDAPDEEVEGQARATLETLRAWAKDIVDTGYYIRTKDEVGNAFVPLTDNGFINDLASLTIYEPFSQKAECNARLAASLIAYEDPLDIDCQDGISWLYDTIATYQHYFNERNIIRYFHAAGVGMALMMGENERARGMLEGLVTKVEDIQEEDGFHRERTDYWADVASFLLVSASNGLPLTNDEARYVADVFAASAEHYANWPYWDPWDDSVPDGTHEMSPSRYVSPEWEAIRVREMGYLLEYCYTPLRNPAGAAFVDCDVILDPSRWGE